MIYFNSDNLKAYYANTLITRMYLGDTLIYGDDPGDGGLISITPDGQGLTLKAGYPIEYEDYNTGNRETTPLEADIEIPNLTQEVFGSGFYWSPPSMVNTTYGTDLGTTQVTSDTWSGPIGNLDRANIIRYFGGNSVSFTGNSTKTNCLIDAYSFSCSGMKVGEPYYITAGCCIRSQSSDWVYGSTKKVYLVDLTNKVIIKEQTAYTNLWDRTDTFYVTYTAPSANITFGVIYEFDSIKNNYSGSRSLPIELVTGSSYTRSKVQPVSYTYNYNKVFTLSLDAYKFDPDYPVEVQMFATKGTDSYGTPIARYKVNENNVVYDLELVE